MTATDDDIEITLRQAQQHQGQDTLIMLQVGIDDGDIGCAAGENSFDAGGGKAAPADALETTHARVLFSEGADSLGRAVGRIVIDKDDFPRRSSERDCDPAYQFVDVVVLVESRHDNGKDWHGIGVFRREGCLRVERVPVVGELQHANSVRVVSVNMAWKRFTRCKSACGETPFGNGSKLNSKTLCQWILCT